MLADTKVDVVLLDLMLPGVDGFAVCRRLRACGDLPIIMVTARTDSADVVAGLEAGADDYVSKPLVATELAARVRALLRRRRPVAGRPLRIHGIEIRHLHASRPAGCGLRGGGGGLDAPPGPRIELRGHRDGR